MAGFMGAADFVGVVSVAGCGGYCRMWRVLQELSTEIKKSFFSFFTLTPSQMWLKRPVYRGFKGEGKCEGRNFTLTLSQQTFLLTGKQRTTRTLFSFAPHEQKCFFLSKYAAMQGMIQNNVVILQHRFIPSIQNTRYGWGNLYVILNKIHKYNTEGRYYEQNELQRQYGRKKHKRGTDSHPHHRTRSSWTDKIGRAHV